MTSAPALGGLCAILVYYVIAWWLVGRDPPPGVVFPQFDPPPGLSPAAVRYIHHHRILDTGGAVAQLIQLAVRGHLGIAWDGATMHLTARDGTEPLTPDERVFLRTLLGAGALQISRKDLGTALAEGSLRLIRALDALDAQLRKDFGELIWEKRSPLWLLTGGMLSLLWSGIVGYLEDAATLGVLFMAFLLNLITGFTGIRYTRTMVAELGVVAILHWLVLMAGSVGPNFAWLPLGSTALLAMHLAAWWLLRRRSQAGRIMADHIEGFLMYLRTAEGDELELLARLPPDRLPPESSTNRIEMLIPYAVALGVQPRPGFVWLPRSAAQTLASLPWYIGVVGVEDCLRWIGQVFSTVERHVGAAHADKPPGT